MNTAKLSIVYRIEPGCLGPRGIDLIASFCEYLQAQDHLYNSDYYTWTLIPRLDKSIAELQYYLADKRITQAQAEQYLKLFHVDLKAIESNFDNLLELTIREYQKP